MYALLFFGGFMFGFFLHAVLVIAKDDGWGE